MAPSSRWGYGVISTNQNWRIVPGRPYGSVSIPWHGAVPACLDYAPMIPENALAAARRVCEYHIQSRHLGRMGSTYKIHNPIWNMRVNWQDDDW